MDAAAIPGGECLALDGDRRWSIHSCEHGCVHLSLGNLTLSLSGEEFIALMVLMWRARTRMHGLPPADGRAH